MCTLMLTAVLFTITKIWKQPKCPSVDEWVKQLWEGHLHNEILLGCTKEEILPFATVWMDLKNIILSEISQPEKDKYPMINSHMWNLMNKLKEQAKQRQTHRGRAG